MEDNCCYKLLSGVWSFVIGSLRVILFAICILCFLGEIIGILMLLMADTYLAEFNFPLISNIHPVNYVQEVGLAVLALVGAHGAYTRNPNYLKAYALCIAIYAVLYLFIMVAVLASTDWNKITHDFDKKMEDYAQRYQFDLKPGEELNRATKAWDIVQTTFRCCGLKGSKDWLDWGHTTSVLPRTCCFGFNFPNHKDHVCKTDEVHKYREGCEQRINDVLNQTIFTTILAPFGYLLCASIAVIVAKQQDPDYGSPASPAAAQNFQRLDGSVYIRQPATNEAYSPSSKPNVIVVDKVPYSPPSYVA